MRQGFTIIEVLVAIAVFVIGLTISAYLLTGLQMAPRTRDALTISQATTQWMESATNVWLTAPSFGNINLLEPVPSVANATWKAQACEVDVAVTPATSTCGAEVTSGLPAYSGGGKTTTGILVRLNLTYIPTRGSPTITSLEFAKR